MKVDKNEVEAKRLFTELQNTYDPRKDPTTDEGVAQLKSQLEDELQKLDRTLRKKQLETSRRTLESEVQFYEKIFQKKIA